MICSRCGSKSAWFREDHTGVFERCLCGNNKLLRDKLMSVKDLPYVPIAVKPIGMRKFKTDSISSCIIQAMLDHKELTTQGLVTELDKFCTSKKYDSTCDQLGTLLSILLKHGFISRTLHRKGLKGGSTWASNSRTRCYFEGEAVPQVEIDSDDPDPYDEDEGVDKAEKAVKVPRKPYVRSASPTYWKYGKGLSEAHLNGVSKTAFYKRIRKLGWPLELATTVPLGVTLRQAMMR